jgi:hypothetical protein
MCYSVIKTNIYMYTHLSCVAFHRAFAVNRKLIVYLSTHLVTEFANIL